MSRNVYIFSGLGADHRIFSRIDFADFNAIHMPWIPHERNESISTYAKRISATITEENPVLIGLSFGGMVATEVAKIKDAKRLILISSAATKKEIPGLFRSLGKLGLLRVMPYRLMLSPTRLTNWLFGIETEAGRKLLADILEDTDKEFFQWAIRQIALWDNEVSVIETVHIHGTKDRILPWAFIKSAYPLEGGGHFMCFNRAPEVSAFLLNHLPPWEPRENLP